MIFLWPWTIFIAWPSIAVKLDSVALTFSLMNLSKWPKHLCTDKARITNVSNLFIRIYEKNKGKTILHSNATSSSCIVTFFALYKVYPQSNKTWWPNGHHFRLLRERPGSNTRRVETLGHASVNHSLTGLRCKNGTSECWEDLMSPPPIVKLYEVSTFPITSKWWLSPKLAEFSAGKLKVMFVHWVW